MNKSLQIGTLVLAILATILSIVSIVQLNAVNPVVNKHGHEIQELRDNAALRQ